jgi:hypothetical protein
MVVQYLVDLVVPKNRARCGFTDDVDTTVARADRVFQLNRDRFLVRLTEVFAAEGMAADDAACIAAGIVEQGSDEVLVYARLGVQRDEYLDVRRRVEDDCGV